MSPATLILIVDGWPRETLRTEIDAGRLPAIARMAEEGVHYRDLATPIPSVSVASHTTILTGVNPRWHRIPAHRWRDEDGYRNYIGPDIRHVNRDMSTTVRTFFESHPGRSVAIQSLVNRGADRTIRVPTLSSKVLIALSRRALLGGAGRLVGCWLPKGDSVGHRLGPSCPQFAAEMRAVDASVSRVLDDYDSGRPELDGLRIALIADHGQKDISDHVDPRTLMSDAMASRLRATVNQRRSGPSETLIATSGDSAANVYFPAAISAEDRRHIAESFACQAGIDGVVLSHVDGIAEFHTCFRDGIVREVEVTNSARVAESSVGEPAWIRSFLESYVPGRSGDMLLLAARENDFAVGRRIGWGLGHHRGSHGGVQATEMYVDGIMFGSQMSRPYSDVAGFMGSLRRAAKPSEAWTLI